MTKIVPRDTVNTSLEEIQDGIKKEANEKKGSIRGNRLGLQPIVWVGIILAVLQQFVGINVIFYYSTTLWQAVGFKRATRSSSRRSRRSSTWRSRSSRSSSSTRSVGSRSWSPVRQACSCR